MRDIFLGFEFKAADNWQEIIGPPKKPSNWKQETYEAKLPELQAKQAETAATHVAAGDAHRVCIATVGSGKTPIVSQVTDGVGLMKWLVDEKIGEETDADVFGFELLDSLRLCGWSAASQGVVPPGWIWNSQFAPAEPVNLINLYSCSGAKGVMTAAEMIATWIPDVQQNARDILKRDAECDAELWAAAAVSISTMMGF